MNIASVQPNPVQLNPVGQTDNKRATLQMALLKKAIELQRDSEERVSNQAEGKGQHIDIRV